MRAKNSRSQCKLRTHVVILEAELVGTHSLLVPNIGVLNLRTRELSVRTGDVVHKCGYRSNTTYQIRILQKYVKKLSHASRAKSAL